MKKIVKYTVAIFAAFIMVVAIGAGCSTTTTEDPPGAPTEQTDPVPAPPAEEEEAPQPTETSGQSNARLAAENYLMAMSFSEKGLVEQLEFEGYTAKDAAYAVSVLNVDWMEQAALKAEEYLASQPFSKPALIEQLRFDGFTPAQANYGANQVL